MIVKFEPQPNIQASKAYQNFSDAKIRDFKSNYNCEFLIFFIHSRCKNHLWYSKNSIPKKIALRTLQIVKNHDFHHIWASFWLNPQCCLARSARGSSRARNIFRYEFFRKNRYVLHQKRMQNLWNWLRNNKNRRLVQNHRVLNHPLATLAIYQTGKLFLILSCHTSIISSIHDTASILVCVGGAVQGLDIKFPGAVEHRIQPL